MNKLNLVKDCSQRNQRCGEIPTRWDVRLLKDIAVVNERTIDKKYPHNEIEYIDIASVDKGRIIEIQKLVRTEAPSRAQRIVTDNDILLSTVRPNLKHFAFVKKANPNTIASTGFAVISSKEIDPRFLYYYLTTDKYTDYLSAIADAHTSTYPAFNPDILENSEIPCPPDDEQRAIAKILGDLDEKIELNHQMNKTLRAIAQAIFKKWFVDFNFPGYEKTKFINGMPEGWREEKLGNIADVNWGDTNTTKASYQTEGYDAYSASGLDGKMDHYDYDCPGVVLSAIGANCGDTWFALGKWSCIKNTIRIIASKTDVGIEYIFLYTFGKNFWPRRGSAQPFISQTDARNMLVVVPDRALMKNFVASVNPLLVQINENARLTFTLSQIRDSLLPKLMAGEVSVK